MSAIEEKVAAGTGKDTRSGSQPLAGGVHPVWGLPHESYGDAVFAGLAEAGLAPDTLSAGISKERPGGQRELYLRLVWMPGHPDVQDPAGMKLVWSHLAGWMALIASDAKPLQISGYATPALLADAVLHVAVSGLDGAWTPADQHAEWEHALTLDQALSAAADRGWIPW